MRTHDEMLLNDSVVICQTIVKLNFQFITICLPVTDLVFNIVPKTDSCVANWEQHIMNLHNDKREVYSLQLCITRDQTA